MDVTQRLLVSGISHDEISRRSGLSPQRLKAIANGADDLSIDELLKIANALNLQIGEFLPTDPKANDVELVFRRGLSRTVVKQFEHAISSLSERTANALALANTSPQTLDWLREFPPDENHTYESAEMLAAKFRAIYFDNDLLSPLCNLAAVLTERLGVFLFVVPEKAIDGASAIVENVAFIFLALRTFRPRMLFTLAHELGHLLGRHHGSAFAHLDGRESTGSIQRSRRISEAFADAFASALLLPAEGVGKMFAKIREVTGHRGNLGDIELLYVARFYGVSFEAASRRCEDLRLIPRGGARSLYEKLVKKFGSPEKRAELLGLPPREEIEIPRWPKGLLDGVIARIDSGDLSIGRASTLLQLSIPELNEYHAATH